MSPPSTRSRRTAQRHFPRTSPHLNQSSTFGSASRCAFEAPPWPRRGTAGRATTRGRRGESHDTTTLIWLLYPCAQQRSTVSGAAEYYRRKGGSAGRRSNVVALSFVSSHLRTVDSPHLTCHINRSQAVGSTLLSTTSWMVTGRLTTPFEASFKTRQWGALASTSESGITAFR